MTSRNQPGSFSQRMEAMERDPGNEVVQAAVTLFYMRQRA